MTHYHTQQRIYFAGISQWLIMLAVVSFYPNVQVQVYSYVPHLVNATVVDITDTSVSCGEARVATLSMVMPCLVLAAFVTLFVTSSKSLHEENAWEQAYSVDNMRQLGLWDTVFWCLVAVQHAVAFAMVASPVNLFALVCAVYFCTLFLYHLCAPLSANTEYMPAHYAHAAANVNMLGYALGVGIVCYVAPPTKSNRVLFLFLVVMLDYLLGIGHTWDRSIYMETVANCRLCYVCGSILITAGMYGAWNSYIL
jgi:hypothetical protein